MDLDLKKKRKRAFPVSPSFKIQGQFLRLGGLIMLAAVWKGDAKKVAEMIRQDPGFKVNMEQDEHGHTLLHYACDGEHRSAVIPLLLAHPDINVNVKDKYGRTPFFTACSPPVVMRC